MPEIQEIMEAERWGQCSAATIVNDLKKVAAGYMTHMHGQSERLRALQLARLDALLVPWWATAIGGRDFYAAQVVLKIFDMRNKLCGLDERAPGESVQRRPYADVPADELLRRYEQARRVLGTGTGTGPSEEPDEEPDEGPDGAKGG